MLTGRRKFNMSERGEGLDRIGRVGNRGGDDHIHLPQDPKILGGDELADPVGRGDSSALTMAELAIGAEGGSVRGPVPANPVR